MSLEPVQVMSGQVAELKVAPSSNGDSAGSWEGKREFEKDHLGLTTKPKPVSLTLHPELHVSHFYCVIFPDHKSAKALLVETITWNQTTLCTPLPSLHPVAAPTPGLFSWVSCWHCPRAVLSTPYKKGGLGIRSGQANCESGCVLGSTDYESISSFASVMNELKKKLISSVSARV